MITATLPPHIVPTLPAADQLPPHITPTLPPTETTPGGLLVPTGSVPPGASTTPSGLIVVRKPLSPVTVGSKLVVPNGPLDGSAALDAAKAAHAELAASQGAPVADIVHGGQLELAQRVRNDELREQAIAALLAGDLAAAAKLIGQQG